MSTWAVTTANASLEFDTNYGLSNSCYQIDSNHFINFWGGFDLDGYVQVFTVNTSTWAVTTANASLEFDTNYGLSNSCYQIDSNHFINFWTGLNDDGYVQVFTVNTSTWAVTTANASLEFDTNYNKSNSCYQIDSNHFINFWGGFDNDGYVQVFTVNTSTWAVTTANASLEFDTNYGLYNSCYQIDSNHFINFWTGLDNDGYVQVFTVNTSTWAVTTANASLEFDTNYGFYNSCYQIDSNHFINFWSGLDYDGYIQAFTVNTSTWAVTTANASLEFDTNYGFDNSCYQIDSNHFINFWSGLDFDGYVQVFTVNTSTWAVTTANASLEFDTNSNKSNSCYQIDSNHFINFWTGLNNDGYVQVFYALTPTSTTANDYRFARISGKNVLDSSRNARISGGNVSDSSRDARISGIATSNNSRNARITGRLTSDSSKNARILGKDISNSSRSGRISGEDTGISNRGARVIGLLSSNNSRNARISGINTSDDYRLIRITGKNISNNERDARIIGKDTVNDERISRITGSIDVDSERDARIIGKITTNDERVARISGLATADNERDVMIIGGVANQRNARIWGAVIGKSYKYAIIRGKRKTPWIKINNLTSSWTKRANPTSIWTKRANPTSIWTKEDNEL